MRSIRLLLTLLIAGFLLRLPADTSTPTISLQIRLVDAQTDAPIPGLIRIRDSLGNVVHPPQLLSRGLGLNRDNTTPAQSAIQDWSVLPSAAMFSVPRGKLTIDAISGLETEQATLTLDSTQPPTSDITLKLKRFSDLSPQNWRAANTHLHLMKLSRADADRYLTEIPRADRLDLLFVSYLERTGADQDYISNAITTADLQKYQSASGVLFGNGEEHRHNFGSGGTGYGHVMLLDIPRLIQPVSIGPGIMKTGTDGIPLQRGIDTARKDNAKILWCHNAWGREALPNVISRRIDAYNIFDGSINSTYDHEFYRFLNAGFPVVFSTGTDWFQYDFSRVFVHATGPLSVKSWLDRLATGTTFITNGPLLEFNVVNQPIGSTLKLSQPGEVPVHARIKGRVDFKTLELVRNGTLIRSVTSHPVGGHFEADLDVSLRIDAPCWLALRTPPPPLDKDPADSPHGVRNELGRWIFAHTSPIYVEVAGQRHFDRRVAESLLADLKQAQQEIRSLGSFADDAERARVLDVYLAAQQQLAYLIAQSQP